MTKVYNFFFNTYQNTPIDFIILELIVLVFGIASVVYAKKEDILVFPTGLIATTITVYLLYKNEYLGDMTMNLYYSIMSIYGWWNWIPKKNNNKSISISRANLQEKKVGVFISILTMIFTYALYRFFDYEIKIENYIDIFTSGIFFTAMWYMANKKIENWILWILADLITIPLYAYLGLGMLSLQYIIFTILAIQGYLEWKIKLNKTEKLNNKSLN